MSTHAGLHGLAASAPALAAWLEANAETLDTDATLCGDVVPQLAAAGLLRIGVPAELGGDGGTIGEAIDSVADVAEHSFAAAFVLWGQRTFIEYLLQSPNRGLRERLLPALLSGELAGATGLSNAMKYLSAIEPLQIRAANVPDTHGALGKPAWRVTGGLPWITNLRKQGFVAAAAADHDAGGPPSIFAIAHDAPGVTRSDDLDLIGLRGTNTAALQMADTPLTDDDRITDNAPAWLVRVRPAFLGLQCGMSVGLARRSLAGTNESGPGARAAVADEATALTEQLATLRTRLKAGVAQGEFVETPARLFELRIALAGVVHNAATLEVQTGGGRGYLRGLSGVARRQREAAFVPIVTPSLVQLKNQLAAQRAQQLRTGTVS
ncbi:acyl-CoA dehydrogenase family protein [Pandoraea apista]|uniref:acyl-CoA dehydrogenase family protein n=1 Tax=Pandoraea apista TaxID=93218 RepID=UPI0005A87746|nr:acyl-CoA dehydrogenase family protein [Pandoraea apista]AJE99667.2 acyl-CoA dehydrogenase [Pandoraea apista]AKH73793.1 acyl-CoA dehydrogenase [Pandoraea apista]AKI62341.1 acyl-CoA dehydrogenase [Pandoraea apista]ALS64060.1 acyl-CoA dehydrogenase [Pandoraea apista]RRW98768.1 acyl-CoA dehydrogenase [Pandoraea apista]